MDYGKSSRHIFYFALAFVLVFVRFLALAINHLLNQENIDQDQVSDNDKGKD